jgi:hypothetical protein
MSSSDEASKLLLVAPIVYRESGSVARVHLDDFDGVGMLGVAVLDCIGLRRADLFHDSLLLSIESATPVSVL